MTPKKTVVPPQPSIRAYNAVQKGEAKKICAILMEEINLGLKGAESKVWHGHPVWFFEGNPIVGYGSLKESVQLLFWSGRSLKEPGLQNEGTYQAAEKRYQTSAEIKTTELRRWLKKAKSIQWDYKNIVKRRGRLIRL